jgi:endogenous inhibitor of DNA gyrase (YacG/DUF329 family)
MPAAPRLVDCPTCKRPCVFGLENRWRPFCSARCRGADLGAWASESYRMTGGEAEEDADAPGRDRADDASS